MPGVKREFIREFIVSGIKIRPPRRPLNTRLLNFNQAIACFTNSSKASIYPTLHANMRVPYVTDPVPTKNEEEAAIVDRIKARRNPRPLQPLDLALLHAPSIADGWNSFLGAVRTQNSLADDVREIAISRVAVCNKAWYEWGHHAPLAIEGGVSKAGMEAIKQETLSVERPTDLTEKLWSVVLYTEEMTRNVQVKDETFDRLRGFFNEQEIVELTATVACYNCVSRFLVALDGTSKHINLFIMV
ncbi:AhpD-like protein [Mariannaea sp. PMI_226]|nr:AhpD-like protein [Mariannaea sp. PMI_226]